MRRLILLTLALASSGCTTLSIHSVRQTFVTDAPLEVNCVEFPSNDTGKFNVLLRKSYEQGWRVSSVGTSTTSFLFLSSSDLYVCFEKKSK